VQLTGENTFAAGTTIASGTLAIDSDQALGNPGGGVTFVGAGTLQTLDNLTLAATRWISTSDDPAVNATIDGHGYFLTVTGPVSGAGSLTTVDGSHTGAGNVVLDPTTPGLNSYTGGTIVGSGTLYVCCTAGFSQGTALTICAGAAMILGADPPSTHTLATPVSTLPPVISGKSGGNSAGSLPRSPVSTNPTASGGNPSAGAGSSCGNDLSGGPLTVCELSALITQQEAAAAQAIAAALYPATPVNSAAAEFQASPVEIGVGIILQASNEAGRNTTSAAVYAALTQVFVGMGATIAPSGANITYYANPTNNPALNLFDSILVYMQSNDVTFD
jgi:autotransporter-associated beta strand protein